MSVVLKRTFIGIGLLSALAGILFLDYWLETSKVVKELPAGFIFTLLVLFIANLTAFEVVKLIRRLQIKISLVLTLIGINVLILSAFTAANILRDSQNYVQDTNFSLLKTGSFGDAKVNDDFIQNDMNTRLIEHSDVPTISEEDFNVVTNRAIFYTMRNNVLNPVPEYFLMLFAAGFTFFFIILLTVLFAKSGEYHDRVMTLIMTSFVYFLIATPYALSVLIRSTPFLGVQIIIFIILVSRMGDSGAFFVGKAFGRVKAFPNISPKKTIEGCLGGLLTSIGFGLLLANLFNFEPVFHVNNFASGAVLGLIVGVTAQIADLLSSLLKRWAQVKDSSNLIPEFGGILDLTDNFILTVPVVYIAILIVWV